MPQKRGDLKLYMYVCSSFSEHCSTDFNRGLRRDFD